MSLGVVGRGVRAAGSGVVTALLIVGCAGGPPAPTAPTTAPTTGPTTTPTAAPTAPTTAQLRAAEARIVSLLAEFRTAAGLPPLARDPALDAVARAWSEELAAAGTPAHNPAYASQLPDGWTTSGENVGWVDTARYPIDVMPAALHDGWLDSPSHLANMDNAAYTAVGVGVAYDGEAGLYVTENFAGYPGARADRGAPGDDL